MFLSKFLKMDIKWKLIILYIICTVPLIAVTLGEDDNIYQFVSVLLSTVVLTVAYTKIIIVDPVYKTESRYKMIFDNAAEAIVIVRDLNFIFYNDKLMELTEYTKEDFNFKRVKLRDIIHPDDLKMVLDNYYKRLNKKEVPHIYSFRIITATGKLKWVLMSAVMEDNWNGKSVVICFLTDVTNDKEVGEIIKHSEQSLKAILEASPIGITKINGDKRCIKWANDVFSKMTGYSNEELNDSYSRILYSSDEEFERVGEELYKKRGWVETELIRKNKTNFQAYLKSEKIKNGGDYPSYIVTITDITEKKELEDQLIRSKKMEALASLAGGIAHDLNNILSVLIGYPELLLMCLEEGGEVNEGFKKKIEMIKKSAEKASSIVQDLLTLSRKNNVKTFNTINLESVISEYCESPEQKSLQEEFPLVKFSKNIQKDLLNIDGSSIHLHKIIMNLVRNAAESICGEGEVKIQIENEYIDKEMIGYDKVNEGDYVVLNVHDSGKGMTKEVIDRIFEPFYTTKNTSKNSGSGLGLSVVWGTVKDHHGYIDVCSKIGEGTTFKLYFPATRSVLTSTKKLEVPIKDYEGKGELVVVIDDSVEQLQVAKEMLIALNYKVETFYDCDKGIDFIKKNEVDLVILDMIMPDKDGLEVFKKIKEFKPDQKAIIMSGYSENERVKEALKLGVKKYIRKPYVFEKVGVSVRTVLED